MLGTLDTPGRLRARVNTPLPASDLVIGMPIEEAAEVLPRIFNLCGVAQSMAARLAFGLPLAEDAHEGLARDIFKDHILKAAFKWPVHFGERPMVLPEGWQMMPDSLRTVLFGPAEVLPDDLDGFWAMLDRREGLGGILAQVRGAFAPFESATKVLPYATPQTSFSVTVLENSLASRQAAHPVLQQIERILGRGPLWRATAIIYDLQSCLDGTLPPPVLIGEGRAAVPASRGLYAVQAATRDGIVQSFNRITPTDHLLAKGGVMDQSLASLAPRNHALAPLVVDILDPCVPVMLEEVQHA